MLVGWDFLSLPPAIRIWSRRPDDTSDRLSVYGQVKIHYTCHGARRNPRPLEKSCKATMIAHDRSSLSTRHRPLVPFTETEASLRLIHNHNDQRNHYSQ